MDSPDGLIGHIRELERAAAPLELDAQNRSALLQAVATHAEDFLARLPAAAAFEINAAPAAELGRHRPAEGSAALGELLSLFRRSVEETGLKASSPGHVAYIPLTSQTHHSLARALRIAGLGECVVRRVPTDTCHRMAPAALQKAIADDRAAGLRPWLVVATAGTTDVGAIDPLESIGQIAAATGLWYHVDAAYGGFFLLCPEIRARMRGLERSDSLVMDPHKSLFLPYGLGAVLVRDGAMLARAHHYHADYMQDAVAGSAASDSPADLSPELSKHFRGPRLWLPLLLYGVAPFRACLEEKRLLIRYFHQKVRSLGFEGGPDPELTVSTYRWLPEHGDPDAFNEALMQAIHRDGRVFISSTRIGGRYYLRLAVLSFRTHLETIELTLRVLAEKVAELQSASPPR